AAQSAIGQIDEVIGVFDRLLQIADVEAGTRRQWFAPVQLAVVAGDIVELYDAEAEERGIILLAELDESAATLGGGALLASAVANLLDNAIKYAGTGATVRVLTVRASDSASIIVEDDGPGVPPAERTLVVERFYRIDPSRSIPGNGLGLSI